MKTVPELRAYPSKKEGGQPRIVKKGEKGYSKAPMVVAWLFHPKALGVSSK